MKWPSLVCLCALAFFSFACEQHPLPGEPAGHSSGNAAADSDLHGQGEQHGGGKTPEPGEARDGHAQPAQQPAATPDPTKPAEPPKFFPEKK